MFLLFFLTRLQHLLFHVEKLLMLRFLDSLLSLIAYITLSYQQKSPCSMSCDSKLVHSNTSELQLGDVQFVSLPEH